MMSIPEAIVEFARAWGPLFWIVGTIANSITLAFHARWIRRESDKLRDHRFSAIRHGNTPSWADTSA